MSIQLAHIKARLAMEGEKTIVFFKSLSPIDWKQQVYTTGSRWRVRQVLAHFVSSEYSFMHLIHNTLNGDKWRPINFDIDDFNEAGVEPLAEQPITNLISAFQEARADCLALVSDLTENDLKRRGFHPWYGKIELSKLLKLIYHDNLLHLRDVRKALETGAPVPHKEIGPAPAAGQ